MVYRVYVDGKLVQGWRQAPPSDRISGDWLMTMVTQWIGDGRQVEKIGWRFGRYVCRIDAVTLGGGGYRRRKP